MPQNTKSLLFLLLQYELINVFTNFYGFVTSTKRFTKNDVKLENDKNLYKEKPMLNTYSLSIFDICGLSISLSQSNMKFQLVILPMQHLHSFA